MVVAERNGDCVTTFCSSGEELQLVNVVLVRNNLMKFPAEGKLLTSVGTNGDGRLYPHGITFNTTYDVQFLNNFLSHYQKL